MDRNNNLSIKSLQDYCSIYIRLKNDIIVFFWFVLFSATEACNWLTTEQICPTLPVAQDTHANTYTHTHFRWGYEVHEELGHKKELAHKASKLSTFSEHECSHILYPSMALTHRHSHIYICMYNWYTPITQQGMNCHNTIIAIIW